MGLFNRRTKASDGSAQRLAVADFWSWWQAEGRALATASIESGLPPDRLVEAIEDVLDPIDPGLAWETSAGTGSRHLLTVTAAGVPELRPIARRWRLGAPPADEAWAFSDVRLPLAGDLAGHTIELGGRTYDVSQASVDAYVRGVALDVTVHHPVFADLPQDQRDLVTYLLLDTVLGEEAVETWVGAIGSSQAPALDPVPIGGLRSVVADLRAEHTGPDGTPSFAILQGTGPTGSPVLVLARMPLRPAVAPHLDTYVGVAVPYADRTPEGLPGPGSLDALRALEDHLTQRLGGSGEIVAVQSHEGLRVLHTYVDSTTPAAEQVRTAVQGWGQGRVGIEVRTDPGWTQVQHLRG